MNRRGFLSASIGLICAPAIVRASSLMACRPIKEGWPAWVCEQQFMKVQEIWRKTESGLWTREISHDGRIIHPAAIEPMPFAAAYGVGGLTGFDIVKRDRYVPFFRSYGQ